MGLGITVWGFSGASFSLSFPPCPSPHQGKKMNIKQIKNFPNYKVSDSGCIFSFAQKAPRMLKQREMPNGYLMVSLRNKGKPKKCYVHRLVAQAFIQKPLRCEEVNHKNGTKSDNRVQNLEWVSRSENQKHAHRVLGVPSPALGKCGKLNVRSKPIVATKGELMYEFESIHLAAKFLKGVHSNIVRALKARNGCDVAYGYKWKYKKVVE